jgi:hypothetical protein
MYVGIRSEPEHNNINKLIYFYYQDAHLRAIRAAWIIFIDVKFEMLFYISDLNTEEIKNS